MRTKDAGLFIFARPHAGRGKEGAVATKLKEVIGPTRAELGCIEIDSYLERVGGRSQA